MKRKTFNLVSIITTAVAAIAAGVVAYIGKGPITAINDSIIVAEGAIISICGNFVKD